MVGVGEVLLPEFGVGVTDIAVGVADKGAGVDGRVLVAFAWASAETVRAGEGVMVVTGVLVRVGLAVGAVVGVFVGYR